MKTLSKRGVSLLMSECGYEYDKIDGECSRSTWKNHGECFWHAETDSKSFNQLKEKLVEDDGSLIGSYFEDLETPSNEHYPFSITINFTQRDLREATFESCYFHKVNFTGCDLSNSTFEDCTIIHSDFSDTALDHVDFQTTEIMETNFSEADLEHSRFNDGDIRGCDFIESVLIGTNFSGAFGAHAQFVDSHAPLADFSDARISSINSKGLQAPGADFSGADLRGANFENANLEGADFTGSDLRGARMTGAGIHYAQFGSSRVTGMTDFGQTSVYEEIADSGEYSGIHPLRAASWSYRRLEALFEENAMSRRARQWHIKKEEARRKYNKSQVSEIMKECTTSDLLTSTSQIKKLAKPLSLYITSTLNSKLTRHGESLAHLTLWAITIISLCTFLYPLVGGVSDSGTVYRFALTSSSLSSTVEALISSFFMSIMTFTTLGYGDMHPVGSGARMLAGAESLSGAIFVALVVYVLGRRVAR